MGHDAEGMRIVQILLGAASCVAMFGIGRILFDRTTGLAAGLALSSRTAYHAQAELLRTRGDGAVFAAVK